MREMSVEKDEQKEQLELDRARKGKKAEDCSVFVEDMITSGESENGINLFEELGKERKKRLKRK